ncbi:MAG: hypothetical protein IKQ91_01040 [Oscillospiraceae bacterium]|nr:hypothetical protein [Oscillospiraceae bacterium]
MKIEPMKKSNLPKYAAALAALCAVPMLTSCGKEPDIAGLEVVYTEPYDSELELAGEETVDPGYSEPDVELAGEAPIDEEPESEPEQPPKTIDSFAEGCEAAFLEAFERQELDVKAAPLQKGGFDLVNAEYGDTRFDVAFLNKNSLEDNLAICFYDGSAPLTYWNNEAGEVEGTYADMFAYYAERGTKEFAWGYADTVKRWDTREDWQIGRAAFIDISRFDTLTADEAEQIIMDTRSTFAEEAEQNGAETG